jgi:hypothetical protein
MLERRIGIDPKKKMPRAGERRAQISVSHFSFTAAAAGPQE